MFFQKLTTSSKPKYLTPFPYNMVKFEKEIDNYELLEPFGNN
jgi:hypothetical protein